MTRALFIAALGVTLSPGTEWAIGPLSLNKEVESQLFTVTNSGNIAQDFSIKGSDGLNGWNIQSTIAENAFKVEADKGADNSYEIVLTNSQQALATAVARDNQETFKLQYHTPSQDTIGANVPHNFIITIKASKDTP